MGGGGCISEPEKEEGGVSWSEVGGGGGQRQKGVSQSKMTQVSLAGGATSIVFVATKVCDKTHLLSRQKYACRNKTFVATNICCQ